MTDNPRLEKSRAIYELWRTGDGDMAELAIGLYDLTAHYEALLDDYEKLEIKFSKMKELVNKQAEDEGLWFIARTAPEQYLQAALRKLHATVEEGS